jgi:hypothetical protein
LEAVQDSDNNITFSQKEQKSYFKFFQWWVIDFHIFVSIYCQKFPAQSSNLMKFMAIIYKLYHDVGEQAALYYDEHFRIWRAENPNTMHCDQINPERHAEALQIGVTTKLDMLGKQSKNYSQRLFRAKGASDRKSVCFSFNNNSGKCLRKNCTFPHVCSKCYGKYHKRVCPMSPDG